MKVDFLKGVGLLSLLLLVGELVLILLSWILSAMGVEGVTSLLSGEGVRWFMGGFVGMLASRWLVWLVLLLMSLGCLQQSGYPSLFQRRRAALSYREKTALRIAWVFLVLYLVLIGLLSLMPHALLLSATGALFPSAFSRALIPLAAFGIVLFSVTFGLMSGRMRSLADIVEALSSGIRRAAPLFVLYILLVQFIESLRFVF